MDHDDGVGVEQFLRDLEFRIHLPDHRRAGQRRIDLAAGEQIAGFGENERPLGRIGARVVHGSAAKARCGDPANDPHAAEFRLLSCVVGPQYPNCSLRMRSSRLWPGSNSMCMAIAVIHADFDGAYGAHLVVVGDGGDRALFRFEHLDRDARAIGQQRAAPAPRPERADRRERQERRADGNDRPLHRQIIGGRSGRRRQQHAVGDELRQAVPCRRSRTRSRAA